MIFASFGAALAQLGDGRFLRVVAIGVALSLALLVAVYALFLLAISTLTPDTLDIPLIGPVEGVHTLLGWASLGVMLVLSIFLMVPVAALFAGLFTDDVAAAVEARHYPHLPPVPPPRLADALRSGVNLAGLIVLVNVLALFVLPFAGLLAPLLFWAVNGFLLGWEYFGAVAQRRLPRSEAGSLRRGNLGRVWMAGILMALPLSVPLVNLFVPVIATATFTHLFHRLMARGG